MNLEQLKKEAREEFRKKYAEAYSYIFPDAVLKEGNEWFETQLDTLTDKAFTAGKEAGLKEGFDNGYEAVTGEVIVRSNTSS